MKLSQATSSEIDMGKLKAKQKLGKYVIERKLGEGGFAVVYQAKDTIEGIRVALKMPYAHIVDEETLDCFRHEVQIAAKLEHPHILPLKYADFIEGHFVIVTSLGNTTLEERLEKRLAESTAVDFGRQMLEAVAFAHENRVIHCDIKPDNMLIFPDNHLRLMDFGIARVAQKTLKGSGAGTVGYVAPEQAMGKPSFRSDVFSLGIVLYRLFGGCVPEWPFEWPMPGNDRLKATVHPDLGALIRKAITVNSQKRYRDAVAMLTAFERIKSPLKTRRNVNGQVRKANSKSWVEVQRKEFIRSFGKVLEIAHQCTTCSGPVSETMQCCPWCSKLIKKHDGDSTRFTVECPRCSRGLKADWCYCPWCYGPGFEPSTSRELSDRRYVKRCSNAKCERKQLMLFMRYCPWCRQEVEIRWFCTLRELRKRRGWGVLEVLPMVHQDFRLVEMNQHEAKELIRTLFDESLDESELHSVASGVVAVFSQRSPDKETANEDALAVLSVGANSAVLIVADGCGGMAGGATASRLAVECVLNAAESVQAGDSLRPVILDGIESANQAVQKLGTGAATTLAVVEIHNQTIRPYHIGDSTVLLVGNRGKVKLHTRSHAPVAYGVEAGLIDEADAIHHEDLHLVSNVVGTTDMHIEIGPKRKLSARDTLIVGSDGLFDNLRLDEIVETARKGPIEVAATRLAELANARMAMDDATEPSKPDDLTFIIFRPYPQLDSVRTRQVG